jgi:hypothetical protein
MIVGPKSGVFMDAIRGAFQDNLFTMTTEKEDAVVSRFMNWLNHDARLKPVPDLPDRIAAMEPKLRKLAKNLEVSIQKGKLVVRADAESTALLSLLRRGSDWFDPHPDVDAAILLALGKGAS